MRQTLELTQTLVGPLNCCDEIAAEAFGLALVESGGGNELVLGVGMKLNASPPKRGASLPHYLLGGNSSNFTGLELAEATLGLPNPELVDIRIRFLIQTGDEALR